MKQLTMTEHESVIDWLDQFELPNKQRTTAKSLGRDFADGVLLAHLLKQLYPRIVEMHNYPPRNSYILKLDNWNTLNRKVLRKLGLLQTPDMLAQLCKAHVGQIERLCFAIMTKYQTDLRNNLTNNYDDDTSSDNTDIMCVNVEKKTQNGGVQQVLQKMVSYALYEKTQKTVYEQQQAITILTQKNEHLDNLLKLKCQRIDDLLGQLARKSCRLKMESELFLSESNNHIHVGAVGSSGAVSELVVATCEMGNNHNGARPETTRSLMY